MNTGIAKPIPNAWAALINGYLIAQTAAGRPRTTIGTRRGHLARLSRELGCPPLEVNKRLLEAWFAAQYQWQIETRRGYRNTLCSFFRWAYLNGHTPQDLSYALPKVKARKAVPRPAPEDVWHAAVDHADPRVSVMLQLASVGMRRAEVAQVHSNDLITDGPRLLVHGKGDKRRVIPISVALATMIAAGAAGHTSGTAANGFLFPGKYDGHLSPRWVGRLCGNVMPGVWTMHTLRHRAATRAFRGTRNIRAVQTLLGHESVKTTEIYTLVDEDEVRAAMNAAIA